MKDILVVAGYSPLLSLEETLSQLLKENEHAQENQDMVRLIRQIADEAGHAGVPFLDDAVRNIVLERDRLRSEHKKLGCPDFQETK